MLEGYYDYRSDTITQPTEAMWQAMTQARLGDDGRGDDPTVKELEALTAAMLGKEAALLVTSGTQGNLVSLLAHDRRGSEVLLEATSHLYRSETGGLAAVAGLVPLPVRGEYGRFTPDHVVDAIRPHRPLYAPLGMVCIENTHNDAGGTVWTPEQTAAVAEVAHRYGASVHIDGARLFNAAVALGVSAAELVAPADSVTFCLSKGLSAPVGSLIAGNRDFIARARRARQLLGGTLRQAGVLAAAGLVALRDMERLKDDHATAQLLAQGLARIPGLRVDLAACQTNIVYVGIEAQTLSSADLAAALESERVRVMPMGSRRIRLVTHRHVTLSDIGPTLDAFRKVMANLGATTLVNQPST